MREGDTPVRYLVGTPKGRLTRLEKSFLEILGKKCANRSMSSSLTNDGELFVLVRSERRVLKERSMRRRRLKKLWKRLGELPTTIEPSRPAHAQARRGEERRWPSLVPR